MLKSLGILFFLSGAWRSLVAHSSGGRVVGGSNPLAPTSLFLLVVGNMSSFALPIIDTLDIRDGNYRLRLLEAFSVVPRESFIEEAFSSRAYEDVSLPIGFGQTISRPSTVAKMLSVLNLNCGTRVLEIGSGSGYLTALLAALGCHVYAIEKIGALAQFARRKLDELGYQQIMLRQGDGLRGWKDESPFNAIIISTAFSEIPTALLDQLDQNGQLIAPINITEEKSDFQHLFLFTKLKGGIIDKKNLGKCQFVHAL
jgi:protein-L-isoaspartate(D-aspartate) O-methyltransferase